MNNENSDKYNKNKDNNMNFKFLFEDFVNKIALENAISFNGKANPKALIGKCIQKFPEIKNNLGEYSKIINEIVNKINNLSKEEQLNKLKKINPNFEKEKKEKKIPKKSDGLPELENCEKGVVVRFEPAPSGYLHIGHLFPLIANYALKNKFGGKFILRIADTNPSNINISNYDKVIEDVNWITNNNVDELIYQSDRMDIYYKYLRTLVETSNAYICKCDSETFKAYTDNKEMCPCNAEMDLDVQLRKFDKFMNGRYEPGEAVIRFRADHTHKNPAMRSFSLARINKDKHARVGNKYFVWPTMHLSVAIDDALNGITHVIRGKDHEINMERQKLIHKALGLKSPIYFHMGRIKFEDMELSKTKLSEKINSGEFDGWDDPRVPAIISYKKRGYKSEAFYKYILSLGISKRDSKISSKEFHKGLNFYNKQILEKEAIRFFFVHNPKKLIIENFDELKKAINESNLENFDNNYLKLNKHPENKGMGFRKIKIEKEFLIDSIDFDNLNEGDLFRLMHFANFRVISKNKDNLNVKFESLEFSKKLDLKRNIHFVSISNNENIIIKLQDNSNLNGISEYLGNIKKDSSIQFERFGFVRFDSELEENKKLFYFTHK